MKSKARESYIITLQDKDFVIFKIGELDTIIKCCKNIILMKDIFYIKINYRLLHNSQNFSCSIKFVVVPFNWNNILQLNYFLQYYSNSPEYSINLNKISVGSLTHYRILSSQNYNLSSDDYNIYNLLWENSHLKEKIVHNFISDDGINLFIILITQKNNVKIIRCLNNYKTKQFDNCLTLINSNLFKSKVDENNIKVVGENVIFPLPKEKKFLLFDLNSRTYINIIIDNNPLVSFDTIIMYYPKFIFTLSENLTVVTIFYNENHFFKPIIYLDEKNIGSCFKNILSVNEKFLKFGFLILKSDKCLLNIRIYINEFRSSHYFLDWEIVNQLEFNEKFKFYPVIVNNIFKIIILKKNNIIEEYIWDNCLIYFYFLLIYYFIFRLQ